MDEGDFGVTKVCSEVAILTPGLLSVTQCTDAVATGSDPIKKRVASSRPPPSRSCHIVLQLTERYAEADICAPSMPQVKWLLPVSGKLIKSAGETHLPSLILLLGSWFILTLNLLLCR